jgi:tRNA(Arg) A34 adenosine deaminase TadA
LKFLRRFVRIAPHLQYQEPRKTAWSFYPMDRSPQYQSSWRRGRPRRLQAAVCVVLLIGACGQREQVVDPVDAVRAEADEIYQLLAYAIVDAQWETGEGARRGHNIGALLVEPDGAPAWWALNNNFAEESAIEHAELRLLRTYFDRRRDGGHPVSRLSGYTVYSTLEPCAMCAGAMIMADVPRVVYGQRDVRWGGAAERLALDTRRKDGMAPYPRALESVASTSAIRARLEQSYSRSGESAVTRWLDSPAAREIYRDASRALDSFDVHYAENRRILEMARAMHERAAATATPEAGTQ